MLASFEHRGRRDGPRGAATDVSLSRQQAKIVNAINTMDADIVGLEEIENSVGLYRMQSMNQSLIALLVIGVAGSFWMSVRARATAQERAVEQAELAGIFLVAGLIWALRQTRQRS